MIHQHWEMIDALKKHNAEKIRDLLREDLRHHTEDVPATVSILMRRAKGEK